MKSRSSLNTHRPRLWYRFWCLLAVVTLGLPAAWANDLAIGPKAKVENVTIPIVEPEDFNFKAKAALLARRKELAMRFPELLTTRYAPDQWCYGWMEDRKPWWGTLGLAYYGPGQNSIKGLALDSRFFLNPYLLVGDSTVMPLPRDKVAEADLERLNLPTFLQPSGLRWWPKAKQGEVTYSISDYTKQMCKLFGYTKFTLNGSQEFTLINARDLGFNFAYAPPKWATNITTRGTMQVMPIQQLLHCGGSCGYPGGCNNQSPETPWLRNFVIDKLPARIGFMFWKIQPKTSNDRPDMTFFVNYQ